MSKFAYAGFVLTSKTTKKFVYYELDLFDTLNVIPPPVLAVGIPKVGTFELKAYWGQIQEDIARDYNVTQQTASRWIKDAKQPPKQESN